MFVQAVPPIEAFLTGGTSVKLLKGHVLALEVLVQGFPSFETYLAGGTRIKLSDGHVLELEVPAHVTEGLEGGVEADRAFVEVDSGAELAASLTGHCFGLFAAFGAVGFAELSDD